MQVFISHASFDRQLVEHLAAQLENAGVAVWNPYAQVFPGDNWAKEIGKALESSDLMIVLFTKRARDSATLQHEIQYALTSGNYRGRVVPVLVGFPTFEAGKDVPWVLLRMDPIYLDDGAPDFGPVIERVQSLAQAECNAAD